MLQHGFTLISDLLYAPSRGAQLSPCGSLADTDRESLPTHRSSHGVSLHTSPMHPAFASAVLNFRHFVVASAHHCLHGGVSSNIGSDAKWL